MSYAPTAGQFHVEMTTYGTPAEVDLAVSGEGTTRAPAAALHASYTLTPDCGAGCLSAKRPSPFQGRARASRGSPFTAPGAPARPWLRAFVEVLEETERGNA
jgi:hypothetical protein